MFLIRKPLTLSLAFALLTTLNTASIATAECPAIEFESYAAGTVITTQYPGVTFSAPASTPSCTGSALILDATAYGGTSSGTRALSTRAGGVCEFAPQYLRMVFSAAHDEVTFNLGYGCGTYTIKAYSTTSGGAAISTQTAVITDCTTWHGIHRFVRVYSAAANIRRIEIDAGEAVAETIDDLRFGVDATPPEAYIDTPEVDACVCNLALIRGVACDSDGEYTRDWAEYLRADAAPGTAWTTIGSASTPVCTSGLLYSWNTSSLTSGRYYVKLSVENACGMVSSDVTLIYVDRSFDTVAMEYPEAGDVVAGIVCIDGTVWDWQCFDQYTVRYRPATGGAWIHVDGGNPTYTSTVINNPLAYWKTNNVVDGAYQLSIDASDDCGNTANLLRDLTIDNTSPTAQLDNGLMCAYVDGDIEINGTAADANLAGWTLQYARGPGSSWQTIATGTSSVVNGYLGTFHAAALDRCAYAIRLVVTDTAAIGCKTALTHQSEDVIVVNVGGACDINGDGLLNAIDVQPFVDCLLAP